MKIELSKKNIKDTNGKNITIISKSKENKNTITRIEPNNINLSMKVAEKLKEAALELGKKDNEIKEKNIELKARDEIIAGYKSKINQVNSTMDNLKIELQAYKNKEKLELQNKKKQLVSDLIELYANLNITKTEIELNDFGISQLVELRKALEVTLDKKNTPVRETVNSSAITPVKKQLKGTDISNKETFEELFGKNPFVY